MDADIRLMTRQDVPLVHNIECICFRSPWSKMALLGELRNDVAHYHVLTCDGRIIGYAGMWVLFDEAHMTNIAVLPEYRSRGFATRLMLSMMETASLLGATSMTLDERENNLTAQRMYGKLGFTQNGYRPRYYGDTGEGALLLWNTDIQNTIKSNGREWNHDTV